MSANDFEEPSSNQHPIIILFTFYIEYFHINLFLHRIVYLYKETAREFFFFFFSLAIPYVAI